MKTRRPPALLLGLLYLGFLAYLSLSASQLPDRVATHFNVEGRPDGWMSRTHHLQFMAIFGLAFPLGIVGVFSSIRLLPQGLNIPHRDYWLAPERRAETFAYLTRQSLWFACMALGFVTGLQFAIVRANRLPNISMSTKLILGLAGCFLVGVTAWAVRMVLHFNIPHPER